MKAEIKKIMYDMPYGLYNVFYNTGKVRKYKEDTLPMTAKDFIREKDETRTCHVFNTIWC